MQLCEMREYRYEDYISMTTGYDWREPTDEESGKGSAGTGFFKIEPQAPGGSLLH